MMFKCVHFHFFGWRMYLAGAQSVVHISLDVPRTPDKDRPGDRRIHVGCWREVCRNPLYFG